MSYIAAVPEPATMTLPGIATGLLFLRQLTAGAHFSNHSRPAGPHDLFAHRMAMLFTGVTP